MYGIVNQAIQDLVLEKFGSKIWDQVKQRSKVDTDVFLSNEPYPDADTYSLATSVSEVCKIDLNDVLIAFGQHWVLKTGQEKYGALMKAGGANFREFLINLPNFHSRVMLLFPDLTPPEFAVSDLQDQSLVMHYYSTRKGLTFFMYGLLKGLSELYKVDAQIQLKHTDETDGHHDVFFVSWN
jgi:hypothetical protein